MRKIELKKERGITLIALVITIALNAFAKKKKKIASIQNAN